VVTERPHYVPQTYLRAWTPSNGSDRRLAYRRRNADKALLTSTRNVAVACGIYGTGELGQAREQTFQQLETEWPDLRDDLIAQGDLQGDRRQLLSIFMAVQLTRTIKHTNTVMFMSDLAATTTERPITRSAVREFLLALDGVDPDDAEVEAARQFISGAPSGPALTRDEALKMSATIALDIAPRLEAKSWTVRRFRTPTLWTNDCPVHPWRRPDPHGRVGGIGVETADEVRFPLSPAALLVMPDQGRLRAMLVRDKSTRRSPTNASSSSSQPETPRRSSIALCGRNRRHDCGLALSTATSARHCICTLDDLLRRSTG
jgi:hypothetical protein